MNIKETYYFIASVLALQHEPEEKPESRKGKTPGATKGGGTSGPAAALNYPAIDGEAEKKRREKIISTIESGGVDWENFVHTSSNNYVLQTLYVKFLKNGLLEYLPEDLAGHLKNVYELNLKRNNKIIKYAEEINTLLLAQEITPVFMKGVGNIFDGLYPDPGERIMIDIDLLTGLWHSGEAARLLLENGYMSDEVFAPRGLSGIKHFPVFRKEGLPAFVEIHLLPVNIQYFDHFTYRMAEKAMKPARTNKKVMVMPDNQKIILNFMHSQLVHWGHQHAMPQLRELYDLLLLSRRLDPGPVLSSFSPFQRKTAGFLRVFQHTFGIDNSLPEEIKYKGHIHLVRHKIALGHPKSGRFIYKTLRALRLYVAIPFKSLYDKNYRTYVKVRLRDPEWYERHMGGLLRLYRRMRRLTGRRRSTLSPP